MQSGVRPSSGAAVWEAVPVSIFAPDFRPPFGEQVLRGKGSFKSQSLHNIDGAAPEDGRTPIEYLRLKQAMRLRSRLEGNSFIRNYPFTSLRCRPQRRCQ